MEAMKRRWDERTLSEVSGSFWQACTLQAAVKLDIFTSLDRKAKSAEELAVELDADPRGVTAILDALTAMKLVAKSAGSYSNSDPAAVHLSRNSAGYMGWRILHHHYLLPSWARLDEAVIKGCPIGEETVSTRREEHRTAFLMAMFSNASSQVEQVVSCLDLGSASKLLDLGGGPGRYAAHFCAEYPDLEAVVFDLPTSRPYAEETVRKFGLEGRIRFVGGDFLADPIPGTYDVAWLSHILHSSGPDDCRKLIRKAAQALNPGGVIYIQDFWLDDEGDGPLFPALFALNMLVRTKQGRTYREAEVRDFLSAAGMKRIRRLPLRTPNDSGIITAER